MIEPKKKQRWFVYNIETGTDLADYWATSAEDALRQFKEDLDPDEELLATTVATTRDEVKDDSDLA